MLPAVRPAWAGEADVSTPAPARESGEAAPLLGESAGSQLFRELFGPEDGAARILGREDLPTKVQLGWVREPSTGASRDTVDRLDVDFRMGESQPTGASLQAVVTMRGDDIHVDAP